MTHFIPAIDWLKQKGCEDFLSVDMSGERASYSFNGRKKEGVLNRDATKITLDNKSVIDVTDISNLELTPLDNMEDPYVRFLRNKGEMVLDFGEDLGDIKVSEKLFPHQKDLVKWGIKGGRRAWFCKFGLGKTVIQVEAARCVLEMKGGGKALIVAPLGVSQEFKRDAKELLGVKVKQIRSNEDISGDGIYITHYEAVRDGKVDPKRFIFTSLDEASTLRSGAKTETFRQFMTLFHGVEYKFVATATPSPNDLIEILHYAAYLEIMTESKAKTLFFERNSTKANDLTLLPSREENFWRWVASWGIFITKPSDLSYSDEGYDLPELNVHWICVNTDGIGEQPIERDGQIRLWKDSTISLPEAAREKRASMDVRIEKAMEIVSQSSGDNFIVWHHYEDERRILEKKFKGMKARSVYGSQELSERERNIIDFSNGKYNYFLGKPEWSGSGCNFQRHCSNQIFVGINYKFNDFIQAIHRVHRFGQLKDVNIYIIYTSSEVAIKRRLEKKWKEHDRLVSHVVDIVRQNGLVNVSLESTTKSKVGVQRKIKKGKDWTFVNDDCIFWTRSMESDSVDMVLTSIPFAFQYEYSANISDFGHTRSYDHFWRQMDFLVPELLRVTKPGRVCVVHVKDKVMTKGLTGMGFATLHPFSDETLQCFQKHGWGFVSRITISTDVVRENGQTYRLGWTDKTKDMSARGHGVPEYLMVFRKSPTDKSNSYSDDPCKVDKPMIETDDGPAPYDRDGRIIPGSGYSRGAWQFDASGTWRSNGDRLISGHDLNKLDHATIFKLFKYMSINEVYDHEKCLRIATNLEREHMLPSKFQLLQVQSNHPEVWTDVTRMRGMNSLQSSSGREKHLCPFPLDICERVINCYTKKGEMVYDPFGGIGSTPVTTLKLGRRAVACELYDQYFEDGVKYCESQEAHVEFPTLHDLIREEDPSIIDGKLSDL